MTEQCISDLIEHLMQIEEDDFIPKNIRLSLRQAINALNEQDIDPRIKANKALQELDDISNDPNLPSYVRPQIWNVVSLLESL